MASGGTAESDGQRGGPVFAEVGDRQSRLPYGHSVSLCRCPASIRRRPSVGEQRVSRSDSSSCSLPLKLSLSSTSWGGPFPWESVATPGRPSHSFAISAMNLRPLAGLDALRRPALDLPSEIEVRNHLVAASEVDAVRVALPPPKAADLLLTRKRLRRQFRMRTVKVRPETPAEPAPQPGARTRRERV